MQFGILKILKIFIYLLLLASVKQLHNTQKEAPIEIGKERDSVMDYGESSEEIEDDIGVSLVSHKSVNINLLESGRRPTYKISGEY